MRLLTTALLISVFGISATDHSLSGCGTTITPNTQRVLERVDNIEFDFENQSVTATYHFSAGDPNATLEMLEIDLLGVLDAETGEPITYSVSADQVTDDGRTVDYLNIEEPTGEPFTVTISNMWRFQDNFDGVLSLENRQSGYTNLSIFIWPYYCGNVFPCRAASEEAITWGITSVTGLPDGHEAIFADESYDWAPGYTFQISSGNYQCALLDTSNGGTRAITCWLPGGESDALTGASYNVQLLNWVESVYDQSYPYGDEMTMLSVYWGPAPYGGMETHPRVQISTGSMSSKFTNVHEALHQVHGDRVPFMCNEDFGTLSEGLVDYSELLFYGDEFGDVAYLDYLDYYIETAMDSAGGDVAMMEPNCDQRDMFDVYITDAYYRTPLAYAEFELIVGQQAMKDGIKLYLSRFIADDPRPAVVEDMLQALMDVSGVDPTPTFEFWLSTTAWPATEDSPLLQAYYARQQAIAAVREPNNKNGFVFEKPGPLHPFPRDPSAAFLR